MTSVTARDKKTEKVIAMIEMDFDRCVIGRMMFAQNIEDKTQDDFLLFLDGVRRGTAENGRFYLEGVVETAPV